MEQYQQLVRRILTEGVHKSDRTGTGTISVFGHQLRFDLSKGLPVVTTKKTHMKSVIHEFIWMICHGDTNTKYLRDNGVTIWDEWADENGDLGPVYGAQFRSWTLPEHCPTCSGSGTTVGYDGNGSFIDEKCSLCRGTGHQLVDQVQRVIDGIKANPDSRRHVISLWNVTDLPHMALEPCHAFIQFYVAHGKVSCHMYQRSADVALGVPFNIAFYAIFTHVVAQQTGLQAGDLVISFGDAHIYSNHIDAMWQLLDREPYPLPTLELTRHPVSINNYAYDDFKVVGYQSHPAMRLPVAV